MFKKIIISLIFISSLALGNISYAQCDYTIDPGCEEDNPDDAPIDSGVGLLIGAAAFYTIKKIKEKGEGADQTPGLN
jgi:hypothetical protein